MGLLLFLLRLFLVGGIVVKVRVGTDAASVPVTVRGASVGIDKLGSCVAEKHVDDDHLKATITILFQALSTKPLNLNLVHPLKSYVVA